MKGVAILGSTGSVGKNALDVVAAHPDQFQVLGLAANRNWELLAQQAEVHRPAFCFLADESRIQDLSHRLRHLPIEVMNQSEGLDAIVSEDQVGCVLSGIAGAAGLPAAFATLEEGKTLAIANKESLVMAGELLTSLARERGGLILPVDSEHSAIFQAVQCGKREEVRKIILTASGGPFRELPIQELESVQPEDALRHPIWSMGTKITIDSATMMNKALEIIEAHWLFGVGTEQIDVVVHPQSIVHSMVEFRDGAIIAQMGSPDMRVPIQYALSYPERLSQSEIGWDVETMGTLTFEKPDYKKFPALGLGFRVAETGGTAGAVFNAANEVAVECFLSGAISFPRISEVVEEVLDRHQNQPARTMQQIHEADDWSRAETAQRIAPKHSHKGN